MDPLTIIGLLAQFGPSLLKAIGVGSDVQKVANTAAAVATAITGKSDMVEAAEAMKADPALAAAFQSELLAQETQFEQLYVSDKKDARARDIALAATPQGNVRANWLVAADILIITTILVVVIWVPTVSEFAKGVLTTILGVFLNQLTNIYNFEFGTTRRSREKSDAIELSKGGN
jgi:hypothetical protein